MIHKGDLDAIALPLLRTMIDIVCHDAPTIIPWEKFFAKSPSPEFDPNLKKKSNRYTRSNSCDIVFS